MAVSVHSKHRDKRFQEFRFAVKSGRSFCAKLSSEKGWSRPEAVIGQAATELL